MPVIERNIGNLHDQETGLLVGYRNPVTGKEEDLPSVSGAGISTDAGNALTAGTDSKALLTTMAQAEAEAGTATTARAWSALRVRQAIVAWWTATASTLIKTVNMQSLLGSGDLTVSAAPAGSGTEVQYRNGSALGAMAGTAWDNASRSLSISGATVTASAPVLTLGQVWNNASVDFIGKSNDFTNTASGANSVVERWRVGASVVAKITKDGGFECLSDVVIGTGSKFGSGAYTIQASNGSFYIGFNNGQFVFGAAQDAILQRFAAGVLTVRGGASGFGAIRTSPVTVAQLLAAATAGAGARGFVTDANSTTWGAAAVGGGANAVPVWCNGAGWFIG